MLAPWVVIVIWAYRRRDGVTRRGSGAGERCWTRENEADEPDETDLLHRH